MEGEFYSLILQLKSIHLVLCCWPQTGSLLTLAMHLSDIYGKHFHKKVSGLRKELSEILTNGTQLKLEFIAKIEVGPKVTATEILLVLLKCLMNELTNGL